MDRVEDYWFEQFDKCDLNKYRERDFYHAAMKSVKFVKKSITDQITMVAMKKN